MPVHRTVGTLEFNPFRSSLATISFTFYVINPPIQYFQIRHILDFNGLALPVQQDVGRLDVTVQRILPVGVVQCRCDVPADPGDSPVVG